MESLEQTIEELESELLVWNEFSSGRGWKKMRELLSLNISNFAVTVQQPALSLDQLIATNSAAHRLDAIKYVLGAPAAKIDFLESELKALRQRLADGDTGENDDFRNNF